MIRNFFLAITLLFASFCLFSACDNQETYQTRMEDERNQRARYLEEHGITKENLLPEGIYYQELYTPADATAATRVKVGDDVVVYYTGYFLNGLVFQTNMLSGKFEPRTVRLINKHVGQIILQGEAVENVITGWPPALLKMHKGTRARIVVPSNRAYGAYGRRQIPGYTTLVFELEVQETRKVN